MSGHPWQWTATELLRAIRTRRISSREAVESCFARLDAVNPRVNAVVDTLRDPAFAAADQADMAVKSGAVLGPLHGVPVTVKINIDVAGCATTNGVVAFKDMVAKEDSVPVANLRKSGAIIIGRTNVPAFSTRYFTDNDLYGRTLNPWDPQRTPGGSSGGAAVATAVGIGAIAHGNDRAGSIRYPAYACGVFGLRPTVGRVSDFNPSAVEERGLSSQLANVQGPLARSIGDLRLGLQALAMRDPRDPFWVPVPLSDHIARRPCRAAVFADLPGADIDPAVSVAVRQVGTWLQDAGYTVEEVVPPKFEEVASLFWTLLMTEERAASKNEMAASTSGIENFGDAAVRRTRAATIAYARQLDFDGYIRAMAHRTRLLREWLAFLERYPLVVMPVSWQRPFPIDADQQGNEAMRRLIEAQFPLIAISLLGLPSVAAPTNLVEGVPMGVQLVAGRFQEDVCLAAGEIIEARNSVVTPIEPDGRK
jgi:amidase